MSTGEAPQAEHQREQWGSRLGFVLATIGSAAGLGNIWRFSYVAGENGGAAFLIIYIACVLLLGLPLIVAELSVGRHAQGDAIHAFREGTTERRWAAAGVAGVVAAFLIMSFYAVVAGWALMYLWGTIGGTLWEVRDGGYAAFFDSRITSAWEPVFWQFLIVLISALIVAGGIEKGIEKFNKIVMPTLMMIIVVLAGFAMTLDGASQGLAFLFTPDWTAFGRPSVYLAAIGQAFFSLSVGMAIFVTYGSYMTKDHNIPGSAALCAAGDTLLAIVVGLAIFPAVFTFGFDPAEGPALAFITLPALFAQMPFGHLIGFVFFALLVAAALTSLVSGLEVPVAYLLRRTGWSRGRVTLVTAALLFLVGIPSALSFGVLADVTIGGRAILDAIDFGVSNVLLPISGLLVALFVGWAWGRHYALTESDLAGTALGEVWFWLLRIVAPAAIVLIFLRSLAVI